MFHLPIRAQNGYASQYSPRSNPAAATPTARIPSIQTPTWIITSSEKVFVIPLADQRSSHPLLVNENGAFQFWPRIEFRLARISIDRRWRKNFNITDADVWAPTWRPLPNPGSGLYIRMKPRKAISLAILSLPGICRKWKHLPFRVASDRPETSIAAILNVCFAPESGRSAARMLSGS